MDYEKKIAGYRSRIRNKRTLKFVEFLDIVFDWLDLMVDGKRLDPKQREELQQYLPKEAFEALDRISPTEISEERYEKLKRILLMETSNLLHAVITIGDLRHGDLDLVQFNLASVFHKEDIATMLEWARVHLADTLEERDEKARRENERIERAREAYLRRIKSMPQAELDRLAIANMFDFTPSARTPEERLEAIEKNRAKVGRQMEKFRGFEKRLMDATISARSAAQINVYSQIGKVRDEMATVTDEFREKAREFVSDEGPKRQIRKARGRILDQKKRLGTQVERFGIDVDGYAKRVRSTQEGILEKKDLFAAHIGEKRASIAEKGETELAGAKRMMERGKADFEEDVQGAKQMFTGKDEEMGKARDDFIEKRDMARDAFLKRGSEVETEMYGTLYRETKRFMQERDKARAKFMDRGDAIETEISGELYKGKRRLELGREEARAKFRQKGDEIKSETWQTIRGGGKRFEGEVGKAQTRFRERGGAISTQSPEMPVAPGEAKARLKEGSEAFAGKAITARESMTKDILRRRELFAYDTRFARDRIQRHAKGFREKVAEKKELFGTRGQQLVRRHKAKQKAHLIRNLLKVIRSTH